jgi:hypothetical protein
LFHLSAIQENPAFKLRPFKKGANPRFLDRKHKTARSTSASTNGAEKEYWENTADA